MVCCVNCFNDKEIKAAIKMIGHKGDCPICGSLNTWIYDSALGEGDSLVSDMLTSIIEIYIPDSELPYTYPAGDKNFLTERLRSEWNVFSGSSENVFEIIKGIVDESLFLSDKLLVEPVGIPQLHDEEYLQRKSILGIHTWEEFKKSIRNVNRFHNDYINFVLLRELLREAAISIPAGEKLYRARVSNERGGVGFSRKEMGAPPDDIASSGRANSKGQSCLYLSSRKKTTVKEIRAHAFDYVTIATFKLIRDVNILDLCSISNNSPFYTNTDKIDFLINNLNFPHRKMV